MLAEPLPTTDKLQAALDNATRAPVFPVSPGPSKAPMVKDWPNTATQDPATIKAIWTRYPDANIGVLCDGMIVIDVDVKDGNPGRASLMDLDIDLNTFTVRTPTGGLHVYYRGPNIKNSVKQLGPGLDVRSYHGYVLGPGSTIDGVPYTVVSDAPIAHAPESLVLAAGRSRPEDERPLASPVVTLDALPAVDRATHYLRDEAPLPKEGSRDHLAFKVACAIKDYGLSEAMVYDLMTQHWNTRGDLLPDEDLREKVRNAFKYGALPPGIAAPEHQFSAVSIPAEKTARGGWLHHGDKISLDHTWLFYNLLPATGVVLVTGASGSGKTFLITELMRCVATGKPFFGVEPDDKGAVLYLAAGTEGSGLELRLAALGEPGRLPIAARAISTSLSEGNNLANLQEEIEQKAADMLAEAGVPVRMVVFETLSASGLLKDENDNAEASAALVVLGNMSRRMNALFVTSHHPPKTGKGSRGAGALDAAADFIIDIDRAEKGPVRNVELRKARNAPERALGGFTLQQVVLGQDSRGRDVTSCVVSLGERVEIADETTNKNAEIVLRAIEFALADARKKDADVTEVQSDIVRTYFWDHTTIKVSPDGSRNNQNTAFRRGLKWLSDMGRVTLLVRDRKEWIKEKEPIS